MRNKSSFDATMDGFRVGDWAGAVQTGLLQRSTLNDAAISVSEDNVGTKVRNVLP